MLAKDLNSGQIVSLNLLDPEVKFLFYRNDRGCVGLFIPNQKWGKNPIDVNSIMFLETENLSEITALLEFKKQMLERRSLLLVDLRGQSNFQDEEEFPFSRAVFSIDDDLEGVSAQEIFYRTFFCDFILEEAAEEKIIPIEIQIFQGEFELSWNDGENYISFQRLTAALESARKLQEKGA